MKIKKVMTILLAASLLNISFSSVVQADEKSASIQLAQKDQLIKYIRAEEANLKTDIATYTSFAKALEKARVNGSHYTVMIEESMFAGGSGLVMVGIHMLMLDSHQLGDGHWVNNKPVKIVLKIGAVVITIAAVTGSVGLYQANINGEEMKDIRRNMNLTADQIRIRQAGIIEMKKQVGIDTKNISIDSQFSNSPNVIAH